VTAVRNLFLTAVFLNESFVVESNNGHKTRSPQHIDEPRNKPFPPRKWFVSNPKQTSKAHDGHSAKTEGQNKKHSHNASTMDGMLKTNCL